MGNCLVTQLKGTVSGDLPKLGEVRVHVHNTDANNMYLRVSIPAADRNNITISGNITEVETSASAPYRDFLCAVGVYDIKISPAYTCLGCSLLRTTEGVLFECTAQNYAYINTEDFKYCGKSVESSAKSFNGLILNGDIENIDYVSAISQAATSIIPTLKDFTLSGNIETIAKTSLTSVNLQNGCSGITGNISAFADCINLNTFKLNDAFGNAVTGDIVSLANCLALMSDVNFSGSQVSGSYESLIEGQIANGRVSGSFSLLYVGLLTINSRTNQNDFAGANAWMLITFTSDGATIKQRNLQTNVLASYDKSTGVWTYGTW